MCVFSPISIFDTFWTLFNKGWWKREQISLRKNNILVQGGWKRRRRWIQVAAAAAAAAAKPITREREREREIPDLEGSHLSQIWYHQLRTRRRRRRRRRRGNGSSETPKKTREFSTSFFFRLSFLLLCACVCGCTRTTILILYIKSLDRSLRRSRRFLLCVWIRKS